MKPMLKHHAEKNNERNQTVAAGRRDQLLKKIPASLTTSVEFAGAAWWSGCSFINNYSPTSFAFIDPIPLSSMAKSR